jgi:hypothetical protein
MIWPVINPTGIYDLIVVLLVLGDALLCKD